MIIDLKGLWKVYPKKLDETPASCNFRKVSLEKNPPTMHLPGDIHSSLVANDIIPDPYFGKNELDIQWIGKTDWIVEREFNVTKSFIVGKQFIVLEMADTFVNVAINGKEIGFCNNMFSLWRFEVTPFLKNGKNTITLTFESAERHALELAKDLPYPIPYSVYPVYSPHRNLVRKTQCHAGWDWGPCIMAFGIYGSIRIEQSAKGFIDYVQIATKPLTETDWELEVTCTYTALENTVQKFDLDLTGKGIEKTSTSFKVQLPKGYNLVTQKMVVKNPLLWQVAGTFEGENHLYTLQINAGKEKVSKKIAFRTLEVIAEEDAAGKSLYFKVNGRAIFAKGSNWIPCDALPSRQTPEKYEMLLTSLVEANMNCVRIWGGGQYEKEVFYDLCDRLGILIWHDCMFSCSLYPSNQEFIESVRNEIRHQVLRLQSHPSIALWCGNNEDLGALTWYPESQKNRDRYLIDYDRLNEGLLAKEITALDPTRAWWPSSPSAGPNDFGDNWHSDGRGDMHYWTVWHEGKSFDAYLDIRPRFVSEFGYQSFPSIEGIQAFADESQMNLTSPVLEFHQRNPRGNSIILENFSRYFRFPNSFESMIYLSQVQQALAIKTAVEYWRSLRPHCMGSIIWQLNDVWPVASWSSIEYSGKWKLLHYAAKDFYALLAVFVYKKENKITICVINEENSEQSCMISMRLIDFSGNIIKTDTKKLVVASDSVENFLYENNFSSDTFLHVQLYDANNAIRSENMLFAGFPKESELEKCTITVEVQQNHLDKLELLLCTDKPAFFVSLDVPQISGVFSQNFFTLLPNEPKKIIFTQKKEILVGGGEIPHKKITAEQLSKTLKIMTLTDSF